MSGENSHETKEYVRLTVINPDTGKLFDVTTAAEYTAVDPDGIRPYCREGLIRATRYKEDGEPLFDEDGIYWLRRIQSLRTEMRLEGPSLRIVLDLMQEVERLRQELRRLSVVGFKFEVGRFAPRMGLTNALLLIRGGQPKT